MAASGVFAGSTVTVTFARTLRRVMSSVGRQAFVGVDVEGGGVAVGTDEGAAVGAGVALVPQRKATTSSRRLPPRRKRCARRPSTKQPISCPGCCVGISLLRWSARTDAHRLHRYMIHSGSHRLYVLLCTQIVAAPQTALPGRADFQSTRTTRAPAHLKGD